MPGTLYSPNSPNSPNASTSSTSSTGLTAINEANEANKTNEANKLKEFNELKKAKEFREAISKLTTADLAKLKLKRGQALNFTIQFRDQLEAGKSSMLVLTEMSKTAAPDGNLKIVIEFLITEIESGKKLNEAMKTFPNIFSPSYCALVAAGEKGGKLTRKKDKSTGQVVKLGTLDLIIAYLKRLDSARQKIVLGMLYPTIIAIAIVIAIGFFSFFILPSLKEVFVALNLEKHFGLMGNLLFAMGEFVQNYYYTFPFILAGLAVGIWQFWKAFGHELWDEYQLKLPIARSIFSKLILAETYSLISTLISAGLTTYDCLELLRESTKNKSVARTFEVAAQYIQQGKTFSEALKLSHYLFSDDAYQTLVSGESSGKLDDILSDAAGRLYEQLDNEIDSLIKMIEPACLGVAGVVVGYLLISYYGTISAALGNIR
jgi:type II secretory pathway component PulF